MKNKLITVKHYMWHKYSKWTVMSERYLADLVTSSRTDSSSSGSCFSRRMSSIIFLCSHQYSGKCTSSTAANWVTFAQWITKQRTNKNKWTNESIYQSTSLTRTKQYLKISPESTENFKTTFTSTFLNNVTYRYLFQCPLIFNVGKNTELGLHAAG